MSLSPRSSRSTRLATLSLIGCVGAGFGVAGACTSSNPGDTGSQPPRSGSSSGTGSGSSTGGSASSANSSGGSGSSGAATSSGSNPSGTGSSSGDGRASAAGSSGGDGSSSASSSTDGSDAAGACAPVTGGLLINFENYNPTLDGGNFQTSFGTWPQLGYIGPYAFSGGSPDGGQNYVLNAVTGRTGGLIDGGQDWAVELLVTQETHFGAGLGFWINPCANASAYSGISFWVRGQTPTNTISLTLSTEDTTPTTAQPPGTCPGLTSQSLCGTPPAAGACCAP